MGPEAPADTKPSASTSEDAGRRLVYLAAERTLLTWIRASIAFILLGFAVDRFALLLERVRSTSSPASGWSSGVGLALIGTGVAASVFSAVRYQRFAARYARGDASPGPGLPLAIALACVLALVGSLLAVYLWMASS